jgi:hypothetical protein
MDVIVHASEDAKQLVKVVAWAIAKIVVLVVTILV